MNLIVIISLIIIDLLLLKQYNQQSNITLSFWSVYANECFLKSACSLECGCIACCFNLKGIVLS
ncbi:hypothetical protein D2C90_03300 [Helicobacter pylori]|nr:hypothetical protein D2C90_03300 [Helicobacter pylori]